jgi:SAM-dependent methyltransferase
MEDYSQIPIHRRMLRDDVRCSSFRRACAAVIHPGDVVLDVGSGTGILTIFALQAGARKVYAVEKTGIANVAQHVYADNHVSDGVIQINDDVANVELPERVDVIVSEWLGSMGVNENLLHPVLIARDRWLKPGGVLVPAKVDAWLAPLAYEPVDKERAFWRGAPYGLDLRAIAAEIFQEPIYTCHDVRPETLLSPPQKLWSTDVGLIAARKATLPFTASCCFTIARSSRLSALSGWFDAQLCPDITLSNSPSAAPTHWGRIVFPLAEALEVIADERVRVEFACIPAQSGCSDYEAVISVGDPTRHYRWITPRSSADIESLP